MLQPSIISLFPTSRKSHALQSLNSSIPMPLFYFSIKQVRQKSCFFPASSLFGRSLYSSVLTRTPPLHSVGVQRSTPHYTDKYPYVRYSYGSTDTGLGILAQSESVSFLHFFASDLKTYLGRLRLFACYCKYVDVSLWPVEVAPEV